MTVDSDTLLQIATSTLIEGPIKQPCIASSLLTDTTKPESLLSAQNLLNFRLSLVERQLVSLWRERSAFLAHKQALARQLQRVSGLPRDNLPLSHIAEFLTEQEVCALSATCVAFHGKMTENGTILPHLSVTKPQLTDFEATRFVSRLCLGSVQSIVLDAKLESNAQLLQRLVPKASQLLSLVRFELSGGAISELMLEAFEAFFRALPCNQLKHIHLSGFRELYPLGLAISRHAQTLESLKIDYLVAGHENEVTDKILPAMPKMKSLVLDVASLCETNVELMTRFLEALESPSQLSVLYVPHVQLLGTSDELRHLTGLLPSLSGCMQLVLRFMNLSVPLREVLNIRRSLAHLPCFIASRQFVVAMDSWAPWWPEMSKVWSSPSQIAGVTVFREQIDCFSFNAQPEREWLRLSADDKAFWNRQVAPKIVSIFKQNS